VEKRKEKEFETSLPKKEKGRKTDSCSGEGFLVIFLQGTERGGRGSSGRGKETMPFLSFLREPFPLEEREKD